MHALRPRRQDQKKAGAVPRDGDRPAYLFSKPSAIADYEQPLVEPQVTHFRQVPFRTMVKLPHSGQLSPS